MKMLCRYTNSLTIETPRETKIKGEHKNHGVKPFTEL